MEHSFMHPKFNKEIEGKVFVGEILKSTGCEVSFQILPPKFDKPFLHKHKNHEEMYIFLKGEGQFQVDGKVFDIKEGSIIRIAPDGSRAWRNNSNGPMIFICIQSMAGTIDNFVVADGYREEGEIVWQK
jgi:mannose-6-phosphate isomerase-like protein (cupin superfamily)